MDSEFEECVHNLENSTLDERLLCTVPYYRAMHQTLAIHSFHEKKYDKTVYHLTEFHGAFVRYDAVFQSYPCSFTREEKLNLDREPLDFRGISAQKKVEGLYQMLREMPSEWTIVQVTRIHSQNDRTCPAEKSPGVKNMYLSRLPCGSDLKEGHLRVRLFKSPDWLADPLDEVYDFIKKFTDKTPNRLENHRRRTKASLYLKEYMAIFGTVFYEFEPWFFGRLCDNKLEETIRDRVDAVLNKEKSKIEDGVRYEAYLLAEGCMALSEKALTCGCHRLIEGSLGVNLSQELLDIRKTLGPQLSAAQRHPVILITDEFLDKIPWENIEVMKNNPVTRMSSVHLLYSLFNFHKPHIRNGLREIESSDVSYYIIDPDQNLPLEKLHAFFKKRLPKWKGIYQERPDVETMISVLTTSNSYFFCGHGSSVSLLGGKVNIQRLNMKSVQFLFGCGSLSHKSKGGQTSQPCDAWQYLLAGSCCTIGMLHGVLSGDADIMTVFLANKWLPGKQINPQTLEEVNDAHEPDLLRLLPMARNACKYFGNAAALISRGIPVKLIKAKTSD